jgi:hypothetical protein
MTQFQHFAERVWKQLEAIHLLAWLTEILGWKQLVVSSAVAIALTIKADSERLSASLIALTALGAFAAVLIVLEIGMRILARLWLPQSVPNSERPSTALNVPAALGAFAAVLIVLAIAMLSSAPISQPQSVSKAEMSSPVGDGEGILEGTLSLDTLTWRTRVPFQYPFLHKPTVFIWREEGGSNVDPDFEEITEDYFTVTAHNSEVTGNWRWRARGVFRQINQRQ